MRGWLGRIALAAVLLACTAGSASAAEADWPQLGQTPAHHGFNSAETAFTLGNVPGHVRRLVGHLRPERGRRVLARGQGRRRLHRRLRRQRLGICGRGVRRPVVQPALAGAHEERHHRHAGRRRGHAVRGLGRPLAVRVRGRRVRRGHLRAAVARADGGRGRQLVRPGRPRRGLRRRLRRAPVRVRRGRLRPREVRSAVDRHGRRPHRRLARHRRRTACSSAPTTRTSTSSLPRAAAPPPATRPGRRSWAARRTRRRRRLPRGHVYVVSSQNFGAHNGEHLQVFPAGGCGAAVCTPEWEGALGSGGTEWTPAVWHKQLIVAMQHTPQPG